MARTADYGTRFAVRGAVTAPSLHNTQPWCFEGRSEAIEVRADLTRTLPFTDPGGRELLISCGAALFNLSLSMRHLGFAAEEHLLPTGRRGDVLATVGWGRHQDPTPQDERLFRAMPLRHSHRGRFLPPQAPPELINRLAHAVHDEHADLVVVRDPRRLRLLRELTWVAETLCHEDPGIAVEAAQWTSPPGSPRRDGVPAHALPRLPDGVAWAGRAFTGGPQGLQALQALQGRLHAVDGRALTRGLGTVIVLTTRRDRALDWLQAGRALERLLLSATGRHFSAAFHTQPLEFPWLRERIRTQVTHGEYPQMLLRLGRTDLYSQTPRRPVRDVLVETPPPSDPQASPAPC